jgi:integrase
VALAKHCRHSERERSRCGCAYYWDGRIDGRRVYVNLGPDRAAARRQVARIELDRLEGRARMVPRERTVEAVAARWLAYVEALGRRPQTLRAYGSAARAVVTYFGPDADVGRIDADAVAEFEAKVHEVRRGYGGRALLQALRGILRHGHREGLIEAVPSPSIERRSIPPNPDVRMTETETVATVGQLPEGLWRDLGELVVLTGLRIGEALALRWQDVDEQRATLTVARSAEQRGRLDAPPKTATSARQIRLEPVALALLLRQPREDERIFPRRYEAARRAIVAAMKRAGTYRKQRGWHSLRHENAALRNRAGQSIRDAAAALGHGSHFAMTMSYGWASESSEAPRLSEVRRAAPQDGPLEAVSRPRG